MISLSVKLFGAALFCLAILGATQVSTDRGAEAAGRPPGPLSLPLVEPKIVVSKSRRRLDLYSGGEIVRSYRVGLGLDPVNDKVRQGDRRTPEGSFYIFIKNPKSSFYLSLGLSYPGAEDAERGLREGLISRAQHDLIARAIRRRERPPQNTRLGGDIFIHGNGSQSDWTWGCIALDDKDMKELFGAVPVKTPVEIEH
ncbi:MAG TPA: L,D-transpeptidase [Blastocatellia bacterium]|nr:L,D-transpeptidase [Blastocatellia bacterium]